MQQRRTLPASLSLVFALTSVVISQPPASAQSLNETRTVTETVGTSYGAPKTLSTFDPTTGITKLYEQKQVTTSVMLMNQTYKQTGTTTSNQNIDVYTTSSSGIPAQGASYNGGTVTSVSTNHDDVNHKTNATITYSVSTTTKTPVTHYWTNVPAQDVYHPDVYSVAYTFFHEFIGYSPVVEHPAVYSAAYTSTEITGYTPVVNHPAVYSAGYFAPGIIRYTPVVYHPAVTTPASQVWASTGQYTPRVATTVTDPGYWSYHIVGLDSHGMIFGSTWINPVTRTTYTGGEAIYTWVYTPAVTTPAYKTGGDPIYGRVYHPPVLTAAAYTTGGDPIYSTVNHPAVQTAAAYTTGGDPIYGPVYHPSVLTAAAYTEHVAAGAKEVSGNPCDYTTSGPDQVSATTVIVKTTSMSVPDLKSTQQIATTIPVYGWVTTSSAPSTVVTVQESYQGQITTSIKALSQPTRAGGQSAVFYSDRSAGTAKTTLSGTKVYDSLKMRTSIASKPTVGIAANVVNQTPAASIQTQQKTQEAKSNNDVKAAQEATKSSLVPVSAFTEKLESSVKSRQLEKDKNKN